MLSIGATVLASQTGCHVCHLQVTDLPTTWLVEALNPLSPKIWLIILPSSYNTSCCTSTWWVWVFLLPVCRLLYGYCDVLNGFQNKMQTINNDLISSCKKTCYSIGGRHDRSATSPIVPSEHPVSITSGSHEHYKDEPQIFFPCRPQP